MKKRQQSVPRYGTAAAATLAASLALGMTLGQAHAQEVGFADDFSFDSTRFSGGSFNGPDADFSITPVAEGLRLETGTENPEVPGSIFIQTRDDSDAFGLDATFLDESAFTGSEQIFLEATLYSETPEPGDRNSDVTLSMTYTNDGQGNYNADYCFQRQLDDGNSEQLSEFGGEFCNFLVAGASPEGVRQSMDISLDRPGGTVTVSFGSVTRTITLQGEIYPATEPRKRIQLWMNNGTLGRSVANLHTIRVGDETIDLAATPLGLDRYQPLYDVFGDVRTATVADGMLRLTGVATEEEEFSNRLFMQQPTDYLEATVQLSSESVLGSSGRVQGQIYNSLYNDLAEGGSDGRTGDITASMEAQIGANGRASVDYCLVRIENPDGSQDSGALEDGRYCQPLPMRIAFDEPIRMSIFLDREASAIVYRANDVEHVESIDTGIFSHNSPFAEVGVTPRDLAEAVLLVDEVRTSRTALTETETAAGASEPTAFPDVQNEPVAADSTLLYPYSPVGAPLDFVDDFSQSTALLNFDPSRDRGTYGIALIGDALRLEAAHADPENCCADARIRIQEPTDFVGARVSLSSDSRLTVGEDTRALVRIEGTWYNDTQDGGFDDRGGDVYMQLRIIQRGDASREASFCFDRQTGDGNNDGLNIVDGENCGRFETIPQLDTEYDMSVELDREAATMTLSFADESRVIALGGPVFRASRNSREINVQHEGSSGRAVGFLHSLTTESSTIDFATDAPLIAPYRSIYSLQNAGRSVANVDGRLRMEVDSAFGENNQPRLVSRSPSDYVSATLELSSESTDGGGLVNIGVGGHMYNAIDDGTEENRDDNTGAVYASVNLVAYREGARFIEYCAYQSNSPDFSDALDLISGTEDTCLRFSTPLEFDTPVSTAISLDRSRGVLIFTANDETVEYTITTGIFSPHNYFNGVRANARGGSRMVGFADDLAYSANPVPLADSETRIGFVNVADVVPESDTDAPVGTTDDSEGGGTTVDGGEVPVDDAIDVIASSGGSGGGCSITSGSGGLQAPLLALFALAFLRRRQLRISKR